MWIFSHIEINRCLSIADIGNIKHNAHTSTWHSLDNLWAKSKTKMKYKTWKAKQFINQKKTETEREKEHKLHAKENKKLMHHFSISEVYSVISTKLLGSRCYTRSFRISWCLFIAHCALCALCFFYYIRATKFCDLLKNNFDLYYIYKLLSAWSHVCVNLWNAL